MSGKMEFMRQELATLREEKRFINIRVMGSAADAWMVVDGKRVLNFCTNNYLGLANHPALKEAAKKAVDEWGAGPAAVRTIAGTQTLHRELEQAVSTGLLGPWRFKRKDILFARTEWNIPVPVCACMSMWCAVKSSI